MKRVLVITNNLNQASFRLRIAPLVEPLRERGFDLAVEVRPRNFLTRRRLLKSAKNYDAVLLQRKMLDPSDARLLLYYAKRTFFDVDDAVMFEQTPVGPYTRWRTRRRFHATAGIADAVIAGNEYLAGLFRQRGCRTIVLPTVVEVLRYQAKSHRADEPQRLVWIGSRSTLDYLRFIYPALALAAHTLPNLRLVVIADVTLPDAPLPVDFLPWSEGVESASLLHGNIGIAPTPDNPWTRGKCGFKIVQYMACGLPVIASPVGANAQLVREGVTGYLPTSDAGWVHAIRSLAQDVALRATMGERARHIAENELSMNRAIDVWADLLNEDPLTAAAASRR